MTCPYHLSFFISCFFPLCLLHASGTSLEAPSLMQTKLDFTPGLLHLLLPLFKAFLFRKLCDSFSYQFSYLLKCHHLSRTFSEMSTSKSCPLHIYMGRYTCFSPSLHGNNNHSINHMLCF